jgi:flagellar motor switch protein FliG
MAKKDPRIEAYKRTQGKKQVHTDPGLKARDQNGLLKTSDEEEKKIKGYRKAAKLIILLGKDEAAKVFSHFNEDEIAGITREIARIKKIDQGEAAKIMEEFGRDIDEHTRNLHGGPELAKQMLICALGEDAAEVMYKKIAPEAEDSPFAFLQDLDFAQVMMVLKEEKAPVYAMILPQIDPKLASKVLEATTPETQKEIIRRMAKVQKYNPEVIERVSGMLKERVRKQGKVVTDEVDGRSKLANILQYMDISSEERILSGLGEDDPDLSKDVKERLYTFDLVAKMPEDDLQVVLRDFSDKEIALLLKGKDEEIREKMLSNVSERRRIFIEEEYDHIGSVRRKDVDEAAKDFLEFIRKMEEEGKIRILRADEEYI